MKKILFNVSVILYCISCISQSLKVQNSEDKLIIDFDQVKYSDTCLLASNLFKSVKIIPLETNVSCLIGMITKIEVIDDYILIMDNFIANSLYLFDREGRFIRKIGSMGQGPGEYVSISDFTIDRENKTVYLRDGRLGRIYQYDIASGKYIQSIMPTRNADRPAIHHINHNGGNLYASAIYYKHSPNNSLLFSIDQSSGKEKNYFLNVMEYNKGYSNLFGNNFIDRPFFSRYNGDIIFIQPLMNHIIEITKDGVFSLIEFKGKNMLTTSEAKKLYELYNTKNVGKESNIEIFSERSRMDKYTHFFSYVEDKENIYIEMQISRSLHRVVINKKTNEICVFKCFKNNVLYSDRVSSGGRRHYPIGCSDSAGIYYHASTPLSNGIPELQKSFKTGDLSPDVIGLEKIMELKDDDNPVLLYYEFHE